MLTPVQQRKKYLLFKARETPEQKAIRLQKIREYQKIKYWNATPLEIENRRSYHRKKYRRFKFNLKANMKKKIDELIYKKNNVEEKPKRKYTRRKPVTLNLEPEPAEIKTILPKDDVDLDWQDIFITRLGLQDDPGQQPEIKLEHISDGAQERNFACLVTDTVDNGVVEYPLNEPRIKEEHDGDIPVGQCEPVEDIDIGPEVKQEFICNQLQSQTHTENIPITSLNPELGIKQESEKGLEILRETIKFECTSNTPAKIYPEVKRQIGSTKFSKLPPLRSKHEALRYVNLLEAFALHSEKSLFIGMTGRLQKILKESI